MEIKNKVYFKLILFKINLINFKFERPRQK